MYSMCTVIIIDIHVLFILDSLPDNVMRAYVWRSIKFCSFYFAKYCKGELENYGAIIAPIAAAVSEIENETARELVETPGTEARTSLSAWGGKKPSAEETLSNVPSTLPSTGTRLALDIKKEYIEPLKMLVGTGREKTLQRRRAEFG